jgi:hypothetical protein
MDRPPWMCTERGRRLANRGQRHSCGRCDLDVHFERSDASVRAQRLEALSGSMMHARSASLLTWRGELRYHSPTGASAG